MPEYKWLCLLSGKKNHNGNLIKEYGKDLKDPGIYKILTLWS